MGEPGLASFSYIFFFHVFHNRMSGASDYGIGLRARRYPKPKWYNYYIIIKYIYRVCFCKMPQMR